MVRHLDDLVEGEAPELHVQVDEPHHLAAGERRRGGVVRWAPSNKKACALTAAKDQLLAVPRKRRGVLQEGLVLDDPHEDVPRRSWAHLQGRYSEWVQAWTKVKG